MCREQTPVLQPPRAPLYSRLGASPFLLVPATWSKPEGENFSNRADLKSAAMFPDAKCKGIRTTWPVKENTARVPTESCRGPVYVGFSVRLLFLHLQQFN